MTRPRDSQRSKVYAAEGHAQHSGELFDTVAQMQRYVDLLYLRQYVRRHHPKATSGGPPRITDGRGARHAFACVAENRIAMPIFARNERVLLHEVAHIFTDVAYGRRNVAAHGWQFCATYLDLVGHMIGRDAEAWLRGRFREGRVRFRAPRKMDLSDEQRAALAARFTARRHTGTVDGVAAAR